MEREILFENKFFEKVEERCGVILKETKPQIAKFIAGTIVTLSISAGLAQMPVVPPKSTAVSRGSVMPLFANPLEWRVRNQRRIELIEKELDDNLSVTERLELDKLQEEAEQIRDRSAFVQYSFLVTMKNDATLV